MGVRTDDEVFWDRYALHSSTKLLGLTFVDYPVQDRFQWLHCRPPAGKGWGSLSQEALWLETLSSLLTSDSGLSPLDPNRVLCQGRRPEMKADPLSFRNSSRGLTESDRWEGILNAHDPLRVWFRVVVVRDRRDLDELQEKSWTFVLHSAPGSGASTSPRRTPGTPEGRSSRYGPDLTSLPPVHPFEESRTRSRDPTVNPSMVWYLPTH